MTSFTDDLFIYYKLGEFVAHNMLNGIIHLDMQLDNINIRGNGQISFIDFHSIRETNIPDHLSADICEQLTRSLLPIIDDIYDIDNIEDSFSKVSYFRMGLIASGGLLCHAIFLNTLNLKISSCWYTRHGFYASSYDHSFLYSDVKSKLLIRNWKKQPLDQITIEEYPTLNEYERAKKRFRIQDANRYYMDILYYSRSYNSYMMQLQDALYRNYFCKNSIKQKYPDRNIIISLIEKMAETALHYKHYYTAYGLFYKYLFFARMDIDDKETAQNGLSSISQTAHLSPNVCNFIITNLERDLFELMWILDELDQGDSIIRIPD